MLGGILFSISTISQCRIEGVWNRMLLAGVSTSEILLIFIALFVVMDIVQVFTFKIAMIFLYDITIYGNQWHLGLFSLMLCMIGCGLGLIISINTNSVAIINSSGIVLFTFCGTISGAFW